MTPWEQYVARAEREHAELDLSNIPGKFLPYFQTGQRIKVRMYGEEMTGTVSITTGWRPSLLLIRRSNSLGSSDLITSTTELLAVQRGGRYVKP